ncbi:hypothetical protein CR513_21146, partial [Mucuna pruriens]
MDGPTLEYFKKDVLPQDPKLATKVKREAAKYTLIGEHLYIRGFSFPLLRCLDTKEAEYIMREVHEGVCRSHIRDELGQVWSPGLLIINIHKAPSKLLHFPQVRGRHSKPLSSNSGKDKCIKEESVTTISAKKVRHFYWKKLICRFELPAVIVSNNETQFASWSMGELCAQLKIK